MKIHIKKEKGKVHIMNFLDKGNTDIMNFCE